MVFCLGENDVGILVFYETGVFGDLFTATSHAQIDPFDQSRCKRKVSEIFKLLEKSPYSWDSTAMVVEAEEGNPQAQFELARGLLWGYPFHHDSVEGIEWLQSAAEGGHSEAQRQLGYYLLSGIYVKEDSDEAVKWLSLAAEQNEPYALHSLAYCSWEGVGLPVNQASGVEYLLQAANLGLKEAQFEML